MGGNSSINGNKSVNNSTEFSQIKFGAKRFEMKTNQQRSIFDKLDTNKDGVINQKDISVVNGKIKNKDGKLVEKQYVKLKDLPEGRTLVSDANGKQWVRAKDGTILKADYAKYDEKSGKVEVNKQQAKPQYKVSKEKLQTVNTLIKSGKLAKADFDKQLAQDGWAGDFADGVSVLWGSDNRASKVRDDLKQYDKNMAALKKAAEQGDKQFEQTFEKIYGVKYNQAAIDNYKKNPTDENYQKAFGTKQQNITKRVADYNQSQQTGAMVVKTSAKIAGGVAVGVATGGTGFVALGAAAAGTAAVSLAVEETDRAHITGQHKDSSGKTVKDKGTFREGTDHGKILKDATIDGAAVFAGGAVGKAAQTVAKGRKFVQVGANVTGEGATGVVQEKIQTGEVTLEGALMNAGMSGVDSAVRTGLLKYGAVAIKRSFGKGTGNVSSRYSVPKSQIPKGINNSGLIPANDPDADLNRFMQMGDLVARGTNDVPKQGFWSKLFGGKSSSFATSTPANKGISDETRNAALAKLRAAKPKSADNSAGLEIVNRPKSKTKIEAQSQIIETAKPQSNMGQSQEVKYNHWQHDVGNRTTLVSSSLKVEKRSDGRIFLRDNEGYIRHRLANGEYTIIESSGRANNKYQKLENVNGQMVISDVTKRDYKQYIVDKRGIEAGATSTPNLYTEQNVKYVYDDGLGTMGTSGPVNRNHTHFVENGKYIDLHGELDIDYEVYTASGNVKRTMKLDRSGIIDMPNGAQHDLVKDGPYYYSEDVGGKSFKKIEYDHGRAKISNATKEEYNASINKQVAKAPVKQSISLESIGNKTIDISGTNYRITGHPNGMGFSVVNKITGEYDYVEKGTKITFKDGTTAYCPRGAGDNVKIVIIAQRHNTKV